MIFDISFKIVQFTYNQIENTIQSKFIILFYIMFANQSTVYTLFFTFSLPPTVTSLSISTPALTGRERELNPIEKLALDLPLLLVPAIFQPPLDHVSSVLVRDVELGMKRVEVRLAHTISPFSCTGALDRTCSGRCCHLCIPGRNSARWSQIRRFPSGA